MLRFALLSAVLLAVAGAASAASATATAQRFGDEFDASRWSTDATMPNVRRGVHDERVHYQSTIGTDVQWVSACIADAQFAQQALGPKDATSAPHIKASIGTTPWRGMTRDADGKHSYPTAAPSSATSSSAASSNWLSPSSPLGFKSVDHARRNPAQACVFSKSFREAHAALCRAHSLDALKSSTAAPAQMQPPFQPSSFKLVPGKDTTCAAWGWFDAGMLTSGWNYLYVESNPLLLDAVQARALGFLEGALTVQQISEHKLNEFQTLFGDNSIPDPLTIGFVQDMTSFMLNSTLAAPTDPYWMQVGLQYQQIQGIYEGLSAVNPDPSRGVVEYLDLILLQYDGDMSDIQGALGLTPVPTPDSSLQSIMEYLTLNGHCSALVKVLPNEAELFVAHDTWAGFSSTHRMWKVYNLPLHQNQSTSVVSFSSYPGYIISTDDWYQTKESQLTILETTNDIVNGTLWTLIDSSTVPAWTRTVVATRLAGGGAQWTSIFGEYNSGTYNSQSNFRHSMPAISGIALALLCCVAHSAPLSLCCVCVCVCCRPMDGCGLLLVHPRRGRGRQHPLDHGGDARLGVLSRREFHLGSARGWHPRQGILGQLQPTLFPCGLHGHGIRGLECNLRLVFVWVQRLLPCRDLPQGARQHHHSCGHAAHDVFERVADGSLVSQQLGVRYQCQIRSVYL